MRRILAVSAVLVLVTYLGASRPLADGMIRIRPIPEVSLVPLAIKYHRVDVDIVDNVATTSVDQVFYNPNDRQLEGTYIFPLPEGATIDRFALFIDDKETPAELLDSDKARAIYESIVRAQQDPALLEYMGGRMFKARVFPIPPKGDRRVKIRYNETVKCENGLFAYRYPLNTEKFSSAPLEECYVKVNLSAGKPLKTVFCPSHSRTQVQRSGETKARTEYVVKNAKPDKDYILYYSTSESDVGVSLACQRDSASDDGYFVCMISPKFSGGAVQKKDVVFVLDTSLSMKEHKRIEQARAAMGHCLKALSAGDRFNIVAFANDVRSYREKLVERTDESVASAIGYVDRLDIIGGTNIDEALTTALRMQDAAPDRAFMAVLMTDGAPSVGVCDVKDILKDAATFNKKGGRIFCLGIGSEVNTHLLDLLARENRGSSDYISDGEELEIKVSSFFQQVSHPVMSDLKLDFGGMNVMDVYPKRLNDLFRGQQLTVFGRYHGEGEATVTLRGTVDGVEKSFPYKVAFAENAAGHENLPRLWAMRKVGNLMEDIRLRGENAEIKGEVIRLSKKFGILTPYTSMLVVEDAPAGDPRRNGPPPELMAPAAREHFARQDGAGGVKAAEAGNRLRNGELDDKDLQEGLNEKARDLMRVIGSKTFYQRDGVWVDGGYDGKAETTKIKYLSDEYLALLKSKPEIGKWLALGKRVIVIVGKTAYEVTE